MLGTGCCFGAAAVGGPFDPSLGTWRRAASGCVFGLLLADLHRFVSQPGVLDLLSEGQGFRQPLVLRDRGMGHALLVGVEDV